MPSLVKCIICKKEIVSGALYKINCCGKVMHAACLSIRLRANDTKCPSCQNQLWPDDSSSDYSPSSEDSDDYEYTEDANGIDTKAEKYDV